MGGGGVRGRCVSVSDVWFQAEGEGGGMEQTERAPATAPEPCREAGDQAPIRSGNEHGHPPPAQARSRTTPLAGQGGSPAPPLPLQRDVERGGRAMTFFYPRTAGGVLARPTSLLSHHLLRPYLGLRHAGQSGREVDVLRDGRGETEEGRGRLSKRRGGGGGVGGALADRRRGGGLAGRAGGGQGGGAHDVWTEDGVWCGAVLARREPRGGGAERVDLANWRKGCLSHCFFFHSARPRPPLGSPRLRPCHHPGA